MATVTSGTPRATSPGQTGTSFVGTPSAGVSRRRGTGIEEALGISPDEAAVRQQQTGVSTGGSGYVSGQVAPAGQMMAALGVPPPSTGAGAQAGTTVGTQVGGAVAPSTATETALAGRTNNNVGMAPPMQRPPGPADQFQRTNNNAPPPASGTTTTQSALTTGAPAPPGDTTTRTGAITSNTGAPLAANTTGTTRGEAIAPTGGSASPTVRVLNEIEPGLGDSVDIGSKFLSPMLGDLSPALNSQRAAFGLGDDLSTERYNYRPGEAAAQERVALDKAQSDELRARQMQQLDALGAAAAGTVPSAAELQLQKQSGKNIAATLGQARALGGRSAGGAARAGTLASADILANTNLDAAATRAAEQDRARALLAQTNQGIRGQDVDVASQDARLAQEANANNLRSQLEQNELAERHRQMLLQQQMAALGIGAGAGNAAVTGGIANAAADNKFKAGILETAGSVVGL